MSTKKQISSSRKFFYSVYEEISEEFLDETDVDCYFYHNILDISQSHNLGSIKQRIQQKIF